MSLRSHTAIFLVLCLTPAVAATSQESKHRGRKYKAPEPTSHVEVTVIKESTGKPLPNAAVVFHPVKDGKDEGNLEVKTNDEGKAIIDVIPTGSLVGVQVIADGFSTYAGDYKVSEEKREIMVKMVQPRAQISTYQDTRGKASDRAAGVQEPVKPATSPTIERPKPTNHTSDPTALAPGTTNTPSSTPQNSTPR